MPRVLHLLRRLVGPSRLAMVYDERYHRAVPGVPIDPDRGEQILAFLLDRGFAHPRDVRRPIATSLRNILRVHTPAYLESLQDPATLTGIFGLPVSAEEVQDLLDLERLTVGGTIHATRLTLARGCPAVHLGGGHHHATPERGMGFCVFNDVAVAVRRLQAKGFRKHVLIVDLDLHHGNGTRAAFAADPTVHTFSIHNADWDDSPAVASTDIALGSDVSDDVYLRALREALPPVIAAVQPGFVLYVAGADPAATDALGDWHITSAGMLARDRFVVEQVRQLGGRRPVPLAIVLAGGYGFDAWRYTARFLAWLVSGRAIEPPDDMEMALRRFRPIARELTEHALTAKERGRQASGEWNLSEEDMIGALSGPPRDRRVLGHYSKHGMELLFERIGVFERLRTHGFTAPVLDVDFGEGAGQTVRVFGEAARHNLLIELRLTRTRRLVPGCELAFVEWLLLQNPRAHFSEKLRPLPGQQHPGLGMLGLMIGALVVICDQVGLDGIGHVPSSYSVAVVSRRHVQFLEPEAQARFEALREALNHVRLADAERALAAGWVRDAGTGKAVGWEPAPTVMPVSARLRARLERPEHEAAVRAARPRFRFQLVAPAGAGLQSRHSQEVR